METLLSQLGQVCAVMGAQWGDEGKGKAIDIHTEHVPVVARAVGAANPGQTTLLDGKKNVVPLLPRGLLHPHTENVIGAGTVVHCKDLMTEMQGLAEQGIELGGRLYLSHQAHILLDAHRAADAALEERRGDGKIGTTKQGIGPAMATKALRIGLRIEDLANPSTLRAKLDAELRALEQLFGIPTNAVAEWESLQLAVEKIGPFIADTTLLLHERLHEGKKILIEGAQATMLDLDHGTYPYVTSSATTVMGAIHALGLPPRVVSSVVGVVKAYTTRVGEGPFPTELQPADAERIRQRGGEFGSTTGRPRRCGWLDLTGVQRAAMINGFTHINLTKLDVLDEEATVPVAVGYEDENKPLYEVMPGWMQPTKGKTDYTALAQPARAYVELIEKHLGIPVSLIGTGQDREEMIVRE